MALSGSISTNAGRDGRYYTLSWTATQSIDNNTSTISWTLSAAGAPSSTYWVAERTCYAIIDGEKVYNKTAYVERKNGTVATGTKTISHNSDGTRSFSASLGVAVYYTTVNCTSSGSFTLNTIARASDLSVGNGTLGTAQTITANRKSSSFTHTVTWVCGSYSGTIATKSSATSWSFTPELKLANGAPNGPSVYCEIKLTTYNGSTSIGSVTKAISLAIPASVKPTCSLTLSDSKGYASTYGGYIQGQSVLHVVVNASGIYSSVVQSYSSTANGSTYTAKEFNTSALRNSGTNTVKTKVTDSRGRPSNEVSSSINVLPYSLPNIKSLTASRCDADGTENDRGSYALVNFSYLITSLSDLNSNTATLKYKKTDESDWQELSIDVSSYDVNQSAIIATDEANSYDILLVVSDNFSTTSRQISLSTGYCLYHVPASGKGITFGGIAEQDGFNVKMDAHFQNGLTEDIPTLIDGDCNALLTSGHYYIGDSGTNKPEAGFNGWLTVKAYDDGSYCYQEYVTYQGGRYYRMRDNGTWKPWMQYEIATGSWKPYFIFGKFTYTTQSGSYFRIGTMVYIQCELRTSAASVGSQGLVIGGIPYRPAKYAFMSGILDTVVGSSTYKVALRIEPGASFVRCMVGTSGSTGLSTITTQYPSGAASVQFSGWYQTSS